MSIGLRLLAALIDSDQGLDDFTRMRVDESVFMGEAELEAFRFVYKHIGKYSKLPSRKTCKEAGIQHIPGAQAEPPRYYFDKLQERFVFYRLKGMLENVERDLNDDQPRNALDAMSDTMSLCQMFLQRDRLMNFEQDGLDVVMGEFHRRQLHGDDYGLRLGWPTFDMMTGGLMGGDLITIVGRPGAGKTYLMLHAANTAWLHHKTPLFISMEMKPLLMMQRATAMLTRLPITGIKHAALATSQQAKMQKYLKGLKERQKKFPYWIVDGSLTATVQDVLLLAKQLNPGVVFIDGAYLLRGATRTLSRHERLTEIAERLKGELAEALNIPVVISYQLNREAARAKAGEVGLENIGGSDSVGQLSSVVLGLLQEFSVETLIQRRIEILKGRSGEKGHFSIQWRFDEGPNYMDFSEIIPPKKEDDQEQPPDDCGYM